MRQSMSEAEALLYIGTLFISNVAPFIFLILFCVVLLKASFYIACAFSHDGGWSARQQRQRHKIEMFAAWMAVICFVTGIYLSATGQGEGPIILELPGGTRIDGAGVGVVVIAIGFSIVYLLLQLRKPDSPPVSDGKADHATRFSYLQASLIALILFPFINIIAFPVGIFIAKGIAEREKAK